MFLNVKGSAGVSPFDVVPGENYVKIKDTARQSEEYINKIVLKSQQPVYANGHTPLDSYLYYLYLTNTQNHSEKDRQNRINKIQYWINYFGGRCMNCGNEVKPAGCYDNIYDYRRAEFHHTKPENKTANLTYLIMNNNRDLILKEIEQGGVILLCRKCHQEISVKQHAIENSDEIIRMFNETKNGMEVSRTLNVPFSTVYKCLRDNGIDVEHKKYSEDIPGKVMELFNQGKCVSDIAKELDLFRDTVYQILKKNNIDYSANSLRKPTSQELVSKIIELGKQNVSHRKIGAITGVNFRVVGRILHDNGIITGNHGRQISPETIEKIRELRIQGLGKRTIARMLGIDRRIVNKYDIAD